MNDIEFHPDADIEYRNAIRWYSTRSINAARRFEEQFETLLLLIQKNPLLFPHYDDIRRHATITGYPYRVLYEFQGNCLRILAIAHHHQRPDYFKYRF